MPNATLEDPGPSPGARKAKLRWRNSHPWHGPILYEFPCLQPVRRSLTRSVSLPLGGGILLFNQLGHCPMFGRSQIAISVPRGGCILPYLTRGVMPHRDMHTIHSLKGLRSLHSILDIENVQGIVTFPDHGSRSCMCPNHWPQRAYPVLGLLEPEKRGLRSIARIFSQRSEILLELAVLY